MAAVNGEVDAVQVDVTIEADQSFTEGCAALNTEDFDKAITLFSRALELRVAKFGELAPECAGAYFKYGSALLQKVQAEGDILGDRAVELSKAKEEAALRSGEEAEEEADDAEEGDGDGGSGDDAGEAGPDCEDGQKAAAEGGEAVENGKEGSNGVKSEDAEPAVGDEKKEGVIDGEGDEVKEGEEDLNEAGAMEEEEEDLELAWKLLDAARVIHERQSGHTIEEADVLTALGDVSLEREDFVTGLSDYEKALALLEQLLPSDDRAIAAVCYKMSNAHQLGLNPKEALSFCQRAISVVALRLQHLEEEETVGKKAESGGENAKGKEKEEEVDKDGSEKPASEMEELKMILQDMKEKEEELKDYAARPSVLAAIQEQDPVLANKMQQALAAAAVLANNGVGAGGEGDASGSLAGATVFDAPKLGANQQDLGVVGRGKIRITPAVPTVVDGAAPSAFSVDASVAATVPAAGITGKRRTLEEIVGGMVSVGGENGSHVVSASNDAIGNGDAPHPAKKAKVVDEGNGAATAPVTAPPAADGSAMESGSA